VDPAPAPTDDAVAPPRASPGGAAPPGRAPGSHLELEPELLETLLASSADAFYVVDPDGRVQFANRAAVALLGYDDETELLGRDSHSTIHHTRPDGSAFPPSECPLLRPRTTGEVVRVELDWFVRRDGSMVPIAYSSSPFRTDHGRGAVVVFRRVDPEVAAAAGPAAAPEGLPAAHEEAARSTALELHDSRARIVAAADAARRRLSRDLHDGAQQRLVHVLMTLQSAAHRVGDGATDTRQLLARASDEVQAAIGELRDLVAGVHPAILSDRGLRAAVQALASRSPVAVDVDVPGRRWPAELEACAYFVVCEALANVAKHAPTAGEVRVRVDDDGRRLLIEIVDDGPGGVDPGSGSGLRGLQDRVVALGGTLEAGDAGRVGTRVRAVLPLPD
jgi:PAS domain S-box-containing protein